MMKIKKIAFVFASMFSHNVGFVEKRKRELVDELIDEGRVVKSWDEKRVLFEDGTSIDFISFGDIMNGRRFTHLYMDETIFDLTNGKVLIDNVYIPTVIPKGSYTSLYVQGDKEERIYIFNQNFSKSIDKYNK
jgi:hypothetical protein